MGPSVRRREFHCLPGVLHQTTSMLAMWSWLSDVLHFAFQRMAQTQTPLVLSWKRLVAEVSPALIFNGAISGFVGAGKRRSPCDGNEQNRRNDLEGLTNKGWLVFILPTLDFSDALPFLCFDLCPLGIVRFVTHNWTKVFSCFRGNCNRGSGC